ncbi:MAG: hypothetical protein DRJ11_03590 [Candidatus Aminicenantes bacterium]|nr:MAG: hypothetical protein DRJ11_03590 [Candidatus Aminicenantes bacterium]
MSYTSFLSINNPEGAVKTPSPLLRKKFKDLRKARSTWWEKVFLTRCSLIDNLTGAYLCLVLTGEN